MLNVGTHFDVLHGETTNGLPLAIFDSYLMFSGINDSKLLINSACVGAANLQSLEDQEYSQFEAAIDGLGDWLNWKLIETSGPGPDGIVGVRATPMKTIDVAIPELCARVSFCQSLKISGAVRQMQIGSEAFLRIVPDQPKTITWFQKTLDETRQLISLFCNQATPAKWMRSMPASSAEFFSHPPLHSLEKRVEWFWNRQQSVDEFERLHIAITMDDLGVGSLTTSLQAWLSKTERLRQTRALLFSTLARPAPFLESRFLPIAHAIEVYSRSLEGETLVSKEEFEPIKKGLKEYVNANVKDQALANSLKGRVGYANEKGLKDRILDLVKSLDPRLRGLVCVRPDVFSKLLKDTRNYYTHYDPAQKAKCLSGTPLHCATEQATLLLKIILLKEAKVSESLIADKLESSNWLNQGREIWAEIEDRLG